MDFRESDKNIITEPKNQLEIADVPKLNNQPIITFSPDRSRFDGHNHKSRNSSIADDFDLNLQVSYSTADIIVNQFPPPPPPSTSLTDLLSTSSSSAPPISVEGNFLSNPSKQLNSVDNSYVDIDIINDFTLTPELNGGKVISDFDLNQKQSQYGVNNGCGNGSGMSTSSLVTPSLGTLSGKMSTSCNGTTASGAGAPTPTTVNNANTTTNAIATSTLHLQKKLEKKIAQATAIQAAMNSMSNKPSTSSTLTSPKDDETEFGEWSVNISTSTTASNSVSTTKTNASTITSSTSKSVESHSNSNSTSNPDQNDINSKSRSTSKSKTRNSSSSNTQKAQERKAACVKFQENEVEIISKSSRVKVLGGLIPPERLAVPNKSLANNGNRKHSKSKGARVMVTDAERNSGVRVGENEGDQVGVVGASNGSSGGGTTSEVKPLVEWDSDESEEELSFFPANKLNKAKLTDNLSIDNMSLSGEEDDLNLHLSPPRSVTQKCPCDPRQWINEHVKLPKSNSFQGRSGQCCII